MGKTRRTRQTYHLQAPRKGVVSSETTEQHDDGNLNNLPENPVPLCSPDFDIFKNLVINTNEIAHSLPEFDKASVISFQSKHSQPVQRISKKEKLKQRREAFLNKIDVTLQARKMASDTKRRQKTAVVGDLQAMTDALPPVRVTAPTVKQPLATKVRPVKKFKARQKEMMQDIAAFNQVRTHPAFQQDPEGTILEHLRNKLNEEDRSS